MFRHQRSILSSFFGLTSTVQELWFGSMRRAGRRQRAFAFRTWGGKRKGAGRKRMLRGSRRVAHRTRPRLDRRFPVHVTTRIRAEVPRLRSRKTCNIIRRAMFAIMDEPGVRICHFSVQRRHLHLLCEADEAAALARGMKRFKQRVANGINRQLDGRRGSIFVDRYYMEVLRTPRQTRNVLVYVIQNAKKHGESVPAGRPDPYSSSFWFDGWRDDGWKCGLSPPPGGACVSPAQTWLLASGWRRLGLISIDERPAATRRRR